MKDFKIKFYYEDSLYDFRRNIFETDEILFIESILRKKYASMSQCIISEGAYLRVDLSLSEKSGYKIAFHAFFVDLSDESQLEISRLDSNL